MLRAGKSLTAKELRQGARRAGARAGPYGGAQAVPIGAVGRSGRCAPDAPEADV